MNRWMTVVLIVFIISTTLLVSCDLKQTEEPIIDTENDSYEDIQTEEDVVSSVESDWENESEAVEIGSMI
ncbi:MAG: hypothetical protein ACQESC_04065 [Nanobdellota archaeon]